MAPARVGEDFDAIEAHEHVRSTKERGKKAGFGQLQGEVAQESGDNDNNDDDEMGQGGEGGGEGLTQPG